jgi:hypothetical protein
MPFIVTTKRPTDRGFSLSEEPVHEVSRRAVATLEENPHSNVKDEVARIMLRAGVVQQGQFWARAILGLTESGGTVNPLPDGTMIQVERVTWKRLGEASGFVMLSHPEPTGLAKREIIAAFNAKQAGQ